MNALTIFKALGPIDLRNVRRDSLLAWMPFMPLAMALLLRIGTPALDAFLRSQWGFVLAPYYPLLASSFLVLAPSLAGMIVGFLLLDERDEQVLKTFLVMPVRMESILLYRIAMPLTVGMLMTLIGYPLIGLVPMPPVALLVVAALGALTAPIMALALVAFAENKVAGFAVLKLVNGISMLPVAAYFMPAPWQLLAGIVPAFWPLKVFWLAAAGEIYWLYVLVGLAVNSAVILLLLRRFQWMVQQSD
jgi:fluoroquinolone transport system permease protein